MTITLDDLRNKIDRVDDELLALLSSRAELALAIKLAKHGARTYRPSREAAIIRRITEQNKSALPSTSIQSIFTEIVSACRNLEHKHRVTYLGPPGSYSHESAIKLVGNTSDLIPEASLTNALRAAESGTSDAVLLPIENSSEGPVVETHKLLRSTGLRIVGETSLTIRHNLLSAATKLDTIQRVYAHPQALGQCRDWLRTHLPQAELIAQPSNSRAAELVATLPKAAAIAGKVAAELYGLPILASNINDDPVNQTRFILLDTAQTDPTGHDKTSLICIVDNKPGALHALLGIFAGEGVNLIRLESQPISNQEYAFYLDIEGHQADAAVSKAIQQLKSITKSYINLGSYPSAIGE